MTRKGDRAALALGVLVLGVASGCVDPDVDHGYRWSSAEPLDGVAELDIDAGAQVAVEPGAGLGVVLEYAGGGRWSLITLCDTDLTDEDCIFDILVASDESAEGITAIEAEDLEPGDSLATPDDFALQLELVTGADQDRVDFETTPGATVRVSALVYDPVRGSRLDWSDDPRLFSWIGGGALHWGAPTNPVDLTPDRP